MNPGPTTFYRGVSILLAPLFSLHALLRAWRDGGWRYLRERFGLQTLRDETVLWVHAASVGEVVTVQPLLEAVLRRNPERHVLVTTNTPTGAQTLQRILPTVHHAYLPIDTAGSTRRFMNAVKASELWVVETEVWPWLYTRCHQRRIPITVVNARVTQKTLNHAEGLMRNTWRQTLGPVTFLARSQADAVGFAKLGAQAEHIRVLGDLKHAAARIPDHWPDAPWPAPYPPYVVAASTHPDEEQQLWNAWLEQDIPCLLVLVPRHPERGASLHQQFREDHPHQRCARRSLGELGAPQDRVYLADTLGELDSWYAHAEAVFLGGSLIERGGHNLIEPARFAKAIVVGPHTFNFTETVDALKDANALVEAPSAAVVVRQLNNWLKQPHAAQTMGQAAQSTVQQWAKVRQDYCEALGLSATSVS